VPRDSLPALRWLAAGIPLSLLLDLAAAEGLDSRAILEHEQLVALVATERADAQAGAEAAFRAERDSGVA
jgi:hypothetical protein